MRRAPFAAGTLAAAATVLLAGGAGFLAYHLLPAPRSSIRVAPPGPPPVPPPPIADEEASAAPARKIPEQLPDVALPDLSGHLRRLSDWKGRLLVVNFWATWCEPCQREIPLLKKLRAQRAKEGFEVVGIAVDLRSAVANYARAHGIDYPLLIGEQGGLMAITAFGLDPVFPFTVFADRSGQIITLKIGEMHPQEASLILDRIHDLDRGKLDLASARQEIASGIAALAAERARTAAAKTR